MTYAIEVFQFRQYHIDVAAAITTPAIHTIITPGLCHSQSWRVRARCRAQSSAIKPGQKQKSGVVCFVSGA